MNNAMWVVTFFGFCTVLFLIIPRIPGTVETESHDGDVS